MSKNKKLSENLSQTLIEEFNNALKEDNKKNSQFIRDAIILYNEEKNKMQFIEQMKKGYLEMAKLNLEISEMGLTQEVEDLQKYEVWLTESDLSDDNDGEKRRYILC
jgi:CopG family transcriptional regulator/antitoxin EndoAI